MAAMIAGALAQTAMPALQTRRRGFLFLFGLAAIVALSEGLMAAEGPAKRAVLIGCTTYDYNPARSLQGPGNDARLVRDLLVDRFQFPAEAIRTLVEGAGPKDRPTRANIVAAIEALIAATEPEDSVVLFFAGHGCQQPDQSPADPADPELDGLDEVFLPADIGPWDAEIQSVRNAIVDDEIRGWMTRLLSKKARLLVLFDSCHSGSATRGGDSGAEVPRQVDAVKDGLIPAEVMSAATSRKKPDLQQGNAPESGLDLLEHGEWAALYACLPEEATVELSLPRGATNRVRHGLFTYSLCQVLRRTQPVSFADLVQRIRGEYSAMGRYAPTPTVEGTRLERGVLATIPQGQPVFALERKASGDWVVPAGQLHGWYPGAIAAVESDAGAGKPIGFVRVVESEIATSTLEPVAHKDLPKPDNLPAGAVARLVYATMGDTRLRVAISADLDKPRAEAVRDGLRVVPAAAPDEAAPPAPYVLVDNTADSDWLIAGTPRKSGPPCDLIAAGEVTRGLVDDAAADPQPRVPVDPALPGNLDERLRAIARARTLTLIATRFGQPAGAGAGLRLSVGARDAGEVRELAGDRPERLKVGTTLTIKVENMSPEAFDFTILFVDANFGIEPVFPRGFASDNRLLPGKSWQSRGLRVTGNTVGREQIVMIAVPNARAPVNFAFLAQPTLATAERVRGAGQGSPFETLLLSAGYTGDASRGLGIDDTPATMGIRGWVVQP